MKSMKDVLVSEVPENAQLIDVREVDEFAEVLAAGAVNIPLSEFVARVGEIDDAGEVYVICLSGGRSAQACQYLAAREVDAINVAGGTQAWVAAGLPTESAES